MAFPTFRLDGQVAIVTGAAQGIGRSIALGLAHAGATVALADRSQENLDAVARELEAMGKPGLPIAMDVGDAAAVERTVNAVTRQYGRLDVLVNNASTFYPTPIGSITPDQFDDLVGSNLKAPLFLSQAAAPALAKHEGLILNIGDIHGLSPLGGHAVYSAAKAGLLMLTRSLARELGPAIRVNAIAPGPVMWPERGVDEALRERIVARTALKRSGSADDVARTALFFATGAPFITGQVLAVDGGRLVGGEPR